MARIRSVKPGYFTSLDTAGALSIPCRLHFAGLWTYADDEGRGIDDPRLIKAAVWPLDDEIGSDEIEDFQAELEVAGRIIRYIDERNGRRYFEVTGWKDHQKPNRPQDSAYPAPGSDHCTITERSVNEHEPRTEGAAPEGRGGERRGEVDRAPPDGDDAEPPDEDPIDLEFERFWQAYPRGQAGKPGGDGAKKPALLKWRRMTKQERGASLRAVGNYRDHIEKPDSPHAAHAITWLNQERWEVWQEPAEAPSDEFVGGVRRVQ